jgi:hypothetical protein
MFEILVVYGNDKAQIPVARKTSVQQSSQFLGDLLSVIAAPPPQKKNWF